jgi:peptidoglycan/xylan/chitin deacetylase (PgdA/CDA1 family)
MNRWQGVVVACAFLLGSGEAMAARCANPKALGVSRTIAVDPRILPAVGRHDYAGTLPLAPREVVLTFDDGPRPPATGRVLKALADECVRATFFVVGRQANAYPQIVRRVRNAGHTVATHSQTHPLSRMPIKRAVHEIDGGIASVGRALGSPRSVAPFFRFPGLYRSREAEGYLRRRGIMVWSVDVDSYDYKRFGEGMLASTLARLEARRGGILLMHDVKAKTAQVLPRLLALLKARGFRVVHVVPASAPVAPGSRPLMSVPANRNFDVVLRAADSRR